MNNLTVSARNRARAWSWLETIKHPAELAWSLDWSKSVVAHADDQQIRLPEPGKIPHRSKLSGRVAVGVLIGFLMAMVCTLRHGAGAGQAAVPKGVRRIAAMHAEWSSRTRHLLGAIDTADPPVELIVLLGRQHRTAAKTVELWSAKRPKCRAANITTVIPMSPRACLAALADGPQLLRNACKSNAQSPIILPLREQAAITFRAIMGTIASHWWARQRISTAPEVIFGITGTADTSLFESAIQRTGGRTTHAVHGQATGPNFAGISSLALFRTRHDAAMYQKLGCYGRCDVQTAKEPSARRGDSGILLMTNLAHPMNAHYRRRGLVDEWALLKNVAEAAQELGQIAHPLLWKPHPIISELPTATANAIRAVARNHGFSELPPEANLAEVAAVSRWVLSSPSTAAIDILQAGCLCLLLDPQNSVLDTALASLPQAALEPRGIVEAIKRLDDDIIYKRTFVSAFRSIGPAKPLTLNYKLH